MYHFLRECSLLVFVAPTPGCKPFGHDKLSDLLMGIKGRLIFFFFPIFFLTAPSDMMLGRRH